MITAVEKPLKKSKSPDSQESSSGLQTSELNSNDGIEDAAKALNAANDVQLQLNEVIEDQPEHSPSPEADDGKVKIKTMQQINLERVQLAKDVKLKPRHRSVSQTLSAALVEHAKKAEAEVAGAIREEAEMEDPLSSSRSSSSTPAKQDDKAALKR